MCFTDGSVSDNLLVQKTAKSPSYPSSRQRHDALFSAPMVTRTTAKRMQLRLLTFLDTSQPD